MAYSGYYNKYNNNQDTNREYSRLTKDDFIKKLLWEITPPSDLEKLPLQILFLKSYLDEDIQEDEELQKKFKQLEDQMEEEYPNAERNQQEKKEMQVAKAIKMHTLLWNKIESKTLGKYYGEA